MEKNIRIRISKALKDLENSSLGDGNEITFCFLMDETINKKLKQNLTETEYFLSKACKVYFRKIIEDTEEKVELKLDQYYWPQFVKIKRKCIVETVNDTLDVLVKHPDIKRILNFAGHEDEDKSIRNFLQDFNDYMVNFLNSLIVDKFKQMRQTVVSDCQKIKSCCMPFQCRGCGNFCDQSSGFPFNLQFGALFGGFQNPCGDSSSEEEDSEEDENQSDSDEINQNSSEDEKEKEEVLVQSDSEEKKSNSEEEKSEENIGD